MATRSTIALEYADGTVRQIYCHWDGYLENNGQILQKHYADAQAVDRLIQLGSLSILAPSPECPEGHSFGSQVKGYCVAYGRDRGEQDVDAKHFSDYNQYRNEAQFEEFNYILRRDGNWYVEFYGHFDGLLTEALLQVAD